MDFQSPTMDGLHKITHVEDTHSPVAPNKKRQLMSLRLTPTELQEES